jgi:hypothetical protein
VKSEALVPKLEQLIVCLFCFFFWYISRPTRPSRPTAPTKECKLAATNHAAEADKAEEEVQAANVIILTSNKPELGSPADNSKDQQQLEEEEEEEEEGDTMTPSSSPKVKGDPQLAVYLVVELQISRTKLMFYFPEEEDEEDQNPASPLRWRGANRLPACCTDSAGLVEHHGELLPVCAGHGGHPPGQA